MKVFEINNNFSEVQRARRQEGKLIKLNSLTSCLPAFRSSYIPTQLPTPQRNYIVVDSNYVDFFVKQGEYALPYLNRVLKTSNDEKTVVETLYIIDRMLDNGTKNIDKMYPTFSRFNDTKSPNIQTFLAGIYRKIQVPDAFGPLFKMLVQNSLNPTSPQYFDPNEEIGGAILSYISDRFRN